MSEGLKRKFLEATKIARAEIAHNDVVRHEYEKVLTQLDQIPPSTQEHVELERLWEKSIQMKIAELAALEKARKGIQNLEHVLDEIQLRRHPKSEG